MMPTLTTDNHTIIINNEYDKKKNTKNKKKTANKNGTSSQQ